ncbi:MAG: pitrilysin family protein [Tepidisphaeraceae bacterium]|jgi:predicted Zn-dependent peptidase
MGMTFHHRKLDNALDVIAEADGDAHSFAAGLYVATGSRDESPDINGVSHFLEHMMFKGSSQYTWEDVNRIFDEMGARYNAFTTQESTAYYANVLPEFTARAVEHLAHLLRPAIRPEDFQTEKKVILEEIAMHMDDPGYRIYEALMQEHFTSHPLSHSVLGSPQSIQNLSRDQMAEYFSKQYGAGNTVLAVTGKLDFEQIVSLAEQYCGSWASGTAVRDRAEPRYRPHRKALHDGKLNRQYTMAMVPGPSAQDPRRFAARVLGDVIGDAEGSRLYWALVDNAIAEEADFGFYPHDGCGSFYISLTTDPQRTEQALQITHKELARVRGDLTEEEVQRAKNKIASALVLEGEVPLGRMRAIAGQWVYNKEYRSLEMDMATLLSITADSLRQLMGQFPFEPMTIVTLGP